MTLLLLFNQQPVAEVNTQPILSGYNVQALENDLTAVLHGTTLDEVVNPLALISRAARQLLLDIDPQETKVLNPIGPIFNSVYDYPSPNDLKGNAEIDIFPQVNRTYADYYGQQYNQEFDISKERTLKDSFTIFFDKSTKSLRINAPTLTAPTSLNQATGISNNGTWTSTLGASNLVTNNTNYQSGAGALQFNLVGNSGNSGSIMNSTFNAVDISSMLNQGSLFVYVYMPVGSQFTSVQLQWGSASNAYYYQNVAINQLGNTFSNGWNLLHFPWVGAGLTGTPDPTKINFLKLIFSYSSAQSGVLVNNIFASLGQLMNIEYYSKCLFRDNVTGIYQEATTDPSNLINLDTETYNLLFNLCGYLLAQQTQGVDALFYDANFFQTAYQDGLTRYRALYKSEKTIPTSTYYYQPRRNNYSSNFNNNA